MTQRAKTFSGRHSSQMQVELECFVDLLKNRNVRSYLEIGARHGDTFHAVMSSLPVGSFGVAVDMPGGLWGTSASKHSLHEAAADLKRKGYEIRCLFGDSQSGEMASMVAELAPFDAIFIDGDHTLPGVTKDWNNYGEMAPIVGFHDIVGTGQFEKVKKNKVEVPLLWNEIREKFKTIEFVGEGSAMGIGVCLR